ncbi:MAG: antirestriction protein ArdA [Pseudomonadota bacterium]
MTVQLHAQPYDITALGFYFESHEDFADKTAQARNSYGDPVEEFEIQFIDGDDIDCDLAKAIGINQANFKQYFEAVENWDDPGKTRVILAVGECGYRFEAHTQPDTFDLDIYEVDSLRELAEQFVDEGLFGDIPERLSFYLDYDAIARDLSVDYAEATVAGRRLVYRCG